MPSHQVPASATASFRFALLASLGLLQGCGADSPDPVASAGVELGPVRGRASGVQCSSQLPRSQVLSATGETYACSSDADCSERAHGYCQEWSTGFGVGSSCNYGCLSDADCADGTVCECGPPIGVCVPADCASDVDCPPEGVCARYEFNAGCGTTVGYACTVASDQCRLNADCDASSGGCAPSETGRHCLDVACAVGRPFLVDGEARLASITLRSDWRDPVALDVARLGSGERRRLSQEWCRIGAMEHASVAAFARFSLQLLALGAPPDLLEAAQAAMLDETHHARLAFGLASAYGGQDVGPGLLDLSHALEAGDAVQILRTTVLEGCIGETVAALEAVEGLAGVRDPSVRAVLARIARDEQRHAELAWRFVRWALTEQPGLRTRVRSWVEAEVQVARVRCTQIAADPAGDWLLRHGLISDPHRTELRLQVLLDVVVPSLVSLCASLEASAAA